MCIRDRFSGAGGLDLGFHERGFPIQLAIDRMPDAVLTHRRNFPDTRSLVSDLVDLGPEGVVELLLEDLPIGSSVAVIGGPPCQGFSRANTQSDPLDPRNKLPALYLEIVEEMQTHFQVEFVLFENVMGIRDRKHTATFDGIVTKFSEIGLTPTVGSYSALDFGVAQRRNRVIISGFRSKQAAAGFEPSKKNSKNLTVKATIGDLPDPAFFERGLDRAMIPHHPNHWTMQPVSKRFKNPGDWKDGGRSFRRLKWEEPSPTVAYGNREIHVHPNGTRRLSIYEAMKLQGFPDSFVLEGTLSSQVEQISNAVPPPLANALAAAVIAALENSGADA